MNRSSRMPWTEEEHDVVRKMVEAGHDLDAMARVLKSRSRDAISDYVRKRFGGIQKHWRPTIDHAAMKELFNV